MTLSRFYSHVSGAVNNGVQTCANCAGVIFVGLRPDEIGFRAGSHVELVAGIAFGSVHTPSFPPCPPRLAIPKEPVFIDLRALDPMHPLRNLPLAGISAETTSNPLRATGMVTWDTLKGWRKIAPGWAIARSTYNALSDCWKENGEFRAPFTDYAADI